MIRTTYVVASTPRSGSSLLSEGLEATGVVGRPAEYFAPDFHGLWRRWWGLPEDCSLERYVTHALAYATTPNGVRGVKIHWQHALLLGQSLSVAGDPSDVLKALLPGAAYVNIVRRERRAQALSLFRALGTDEWCRFDGASPPTREAADLVPDLAEIRRLEAAIEWQQSCWVEHFRRESADVLTVEYEQLDADYRGEIARVLDFLGADPTLARDLPPPRLQRQSDELNHRWRRRIDDAERLAGSNA